MGGIYQIRLEIALCGMIYYQVSRRLIQEFKQYYNFASAIEGAGMLVLVMG
jgi:hypothetical protein